MAEAAPIKVAKEPVALVIPPELLRKPVRISNAVGGSMVVIKDSEQILARVGGGTAVLLIAEADLTAVSTGEASLTITPGNI
jgi:hypothetical protein